MGKKGDLTRSKVIQSATYCLLHFGDRKTTFQLIADHSRVSQALVVKYFKNRDSIFPAVLDFWISWAREKTEKALVQSGSSEEKLRNYLRVSIELFQGTGEFARVYLLLHYFAGLDDRYKGINSDIKRVAVARISGIIEDGIRTGAFRKVDVPLIAKTIHNNLVGHVLSSITEVPQSFHVKLPAALEDECLKLVLANDQAPAN